MSRAHVSMAAVIVTGADRTLAGSPVRGAARMAALFLLAALVTVAFVGRASAQVPDSLPGADLQPIRGISYQPAPSDYTAGCPQPCPYYDSDFFNSDFQQLWGSANGGRGDLEALGQLGVTFLHLYDWNPARNHLPFLNEAAANGIRVAVPISNFFVAQDPDAAMHIEAIVREAYTDAQGNPTTVPHPAVAMWTIANEYDLSGISAQQVAQAAAHVVAAEQKIGATELLPVSVPVSFGVFPPSQDPGVSKTNEAIAALHAQAGLPADFVPSRFVAAVNTFNPGSYIETWLPKFKQQVPNTPLWFSEMGTAVQNSCTGYPEPCTPSEEQQATFVTDQFRASPPGAEEILLGASMFEFEDELWKGGTEATFGIYEYVPGDFRTVPTAGGTYRVDRLQEKPSWTALQNLFGGGGGVGAPGGPALGGSAAAISGPGSCDPLVSACGLPAPEEAPPPPAPPSGAQSAGPAVGKPRMPNLRATVTARWRNGEVRVRVRVRASKPRLVRGPIVVRVAIPSLDLQREVRVRLHGKRVGHRALRFAVPASGLGRRVLATVDPADRIVETRERDNAARTRIR